MATDIGIRLGLQGASQVQGGIAAVGAGLGDLDSKAMKAGDAFKKMGGLLLGGLSVGAIGSFLKGAIDAADETFNLSQKVGIAAKDLGGLQLAFKQAGIDSGGMQSALVKLSKNVVDGNAAFGAMGVQLKNTDGSLKGSKQVLSEVADVFQDMPDGIEKTALATQVFGKAGADLIPMLNGGAEGLAEMADMAERLGLVIDDKTAASADQFNDTVELLGMSLQGVGRQVAAEMLPTLTRLAGSLLDSATKGDALKKVAAILSTALRGLYTVAVGIVEIFNTVGKAIGGTVAAVVAALSGDFAGARQILSESASDIKAGWSSTAASIANAWEESADGSIASAAAIVGAGSRTVTSVKATATEHGKAAKAAADYTAEGVKLADSLLAQEQALSGDFRPKLDKLTAAYVAGKLSLNDYEGATQQLIQQQPYWKAAIKDQEQELKLLAADVEELWKWRLKEADEAQKRADSISDQVSKQLAENVSLRYTRGELAQLAAQRLDDEIRIASANVTRDESLASCTRETEAHKATLQALLDLKSARDEGVILAAANEASTAWQKTAEEVGQGLTDSLFRAFEAGKGFFDTLWSGIKNLFKTTVLKLVMQPLQSGMTSLMGSALGMGGTAANAAGSAAGGAGGMGSLVSGGAALVGSLGTFGTAAGFGASALFGGTGLTALSGGASMIGAGSIAGGLGMVAGVLGPIALGLVAVTALLKDKDAKLGFGASTVGANGAIGSAGRQFGFGRGDDQGAQSQLSALSSTVLATVAAAAAGFGGSAAGLSLQAATDIDRKGKGSGILGFMRGGSLVSAVQTGGTNAVGAGATVASKIDAGALGDWFAGAGSAAIIAGLQQSDLAPRFKAYFGSVSAYSLTKEQADAMLSAASSVQAMNKSLVPLGGVFSQLGGLGIEATNSMVALAGGMEAFMSDAAQYVASFYSDAERQAIAARSLSESLASVSVGIPDTVSGLQSLGRDGFRALVDAQDLTTESGRKTYAALMRASGAFAELVPATMAAVETEQDLAAERGRIANERSGLERQLLELQGETVAIRALERAALDASNLALYDQISALRDGQLAAQAAAQAADEAAQQQKEWAEVVTAAGRKVSDEIARLRGASATGAANEASLRAQFAIATAQARSGSLESLNRLPELSAAIESAASLSVGTSFELNSLRAMLVGSLSDTLRAGGLDLPAPAAGTSDMPPADILAQLRQAAAVAPRTENLPAGDRDKALVAELQALRSEVEGLRAEARSTAFSSAKTATLIERVTLNGEAMQTVAA